MQSLSARIRKEIGKKVKNLRKEGILPAVLYGPEIKNSLNLKVEEKEFEKVFKEVGESSLISLEIENYLPRSRKRVLVLIQAIKKHPLTDKFLHIDFYQPRLKEEIKAIVPIVLEGNSRAVKELGGTIIKNISELEVKALPQNLPKEIKVNIESLKTFEDHILVKDLKVPEGVKILKAPEEIVVSVTPPEKIEEELEKPIEEKVEEVKRVEQKKEKKDSFD